MKPRNRGNALLVELLIVLMFFMLAATVLMQVFAKARNLGDRARLTAAITAEAQSRADQLYAAEDPAAALTAMGFVQRENGWVCESADYSTHVTLEGGADGLTRQILTVHDSAGEPLLTLPCSRLREVRP